MAYPNLTRIHVLSDGTLHRVFLAVDQDGTLWSGSAIDGVTVSGSWDDETGQLRFALAFDKGTRRYLGYYMEVSADGSPALAGIARETYHDGSQGDPFGWYAAEDLRRLRLEPDSRADPHSPPDSPPGGLWRIVDRGAIGTLFIRTAEDGKLSTDSRLNAAPISGSWDRALSGLSFVQTIGDPREGLHNSYDGYFARTGSRNGSTPSMLAGIVSARDRQSIQAAGWFAVRYADQ
jgi:hypothetical protein